MTILKQIIEESDKEFEHLRETEEFDVTDLGPMISFLHARDRKLLEGVIKMLDRGKMVLHPPQSPANFEPPVYEYNSVKAHNLALEEAIDFINEALK